MNPNLPVETTKDEMSLGDLLALLLEGRWILIATTSLGLLLAGYYGWRATPIYEVTAMLQIETKRMGGGVSALAAVADVAESPWSMTSEANAETEIILSNLVLGRAVDALRLDIVASPKYGRLAGSALARGRKDAPAIEVEQFDAPRGTSLQLNLLEGGSFQVLDADGSILATSRVGETIPFQMDGTTVNLKVKTLVGKPGQAFVLTRDHHLSAVDTLRSSLTVGERGKQTNILGLAFRNPNPARGAEILNAVLDQFIRQNIERKAEEASKTLAFLQEQMPLLKGKLEVAEEKYNAYRAGTRAADLTVEARLLLEQSVGMERDVLQLRQQKDDLLRRFQKEATEVQTLDQRIAKLQSESKRLEGQVQGLPKTQQEVVRLMRDVQVNQELYTALMNNVQQLQVARAGEVGNARIVDHATPSLGPVKPQKQTLLVLGGFMGLMLGIGLLIVRRMLSHGVENPNAIEGALGLPVLITVPHSQEQAHLVQGRKGANGLLSALHPEDMAVESLRSLRTSLHFTLVDRRNRIIILTGPAPGIGKSFIAANFAHILGQSDARVLLVDGDLRKGKLHRPLGLQERHDGLSEILSGQVEWKMTVQEVHGIHFISTGRLPPNPSELLMGPRLGAFLEDAGAYFDYILIDTPPVLAVTDAVILGTHAGSVLMTLKAGQHPMDEIRAALQRMDHAGLKTNGFIFNDLRPRAAGYGYSRYAYHYGYRNN